GAFEVTGSTLASATVPASYLADGPSTRTVHGRITDSSGAFADYTTAITVNNVPPTATLSNSGPVTEGGSATVSFSGAADPSPADTRAGFHYSFALSPSGLATTYADASAAASTPFPFDDNGSHTVYGRIFDKDGGYSDYTTAVQVNNVPPTASLSNSGPVA